MAPTKHSRTARSARDARGIYAPPSPSAYATAPTVATPADAPPADQHTGPSTSLKRKRTAAHPDAADDFADFAVTKKDKRSMRRQGLMNKVRDSGVQKRTPLKRRRPGKKLKADVTDLADALPDVAPFESAGQSGSEAVWDGVADEGDAFDVPGLRKARRGPSTATRTAGPMVMKSLRHRPGAQKRAQRMQAAEIERFQKNLAQMVGRELGGTTHTGHGPGEGRATRGQAGQAERWAALRTFIGGTMERKEGMAT
jgi:hypothetical protein